MKKPKTLHKQKSKDDWAPCLAEMKNLKQQTKIFKAIQEGEIDKVEKLTKRYLQDRWLKELAVYKSTLGRKSPGPDGKSYNSRKEKAQLAKTLNLREPYAKAKTMMIEKTSGSGTRTLEISNFKDRAREKMIAMTLSPFVEVVTSPRSFGFRPGRSQQDALAFLRLLLTKGEPKWVLDADIESFFDKVSHKAIMMKLKEAKVPNILLRIIGIWLQDRARLRHAAGTTQSNQPIGIPQGSPLSPVLAMLALVGLEEAIYNKVNANMASFADDLVVITSTREDAELARHLLQQHLETLSLNLKESKTRIVHTAHLPEGGAPSFDFLGATFKRVTTRKDGVDLPYQLVLPAKEAIKELKTKAKAIIKETKISKKRKGTRLKAKTDPVEQMISDLNTLLRGWAQYYRHTNAKKVFADIDNHIHLALWRWATRAFKDKPRNWIVSRCFSAPSTNKDGSPALRVDGAPRERKWIFQSPFYRPSNRPPQTVIKMADTRVGTYTMARFDKSYLDGDWIYWNIRRSKKYPTTPKAVNVTLLKKQKGKCALCGNLFTTETDNFFYGVSTEGVAYMSHKLCSSPSTLNR